MREHLVL